MNKRIIKSMLSVSGIVLLGKVLGFIKQMVTAKAFGATVETDIISLSEGLVVNVRGGSVSKRITVRKKSGNVVVKRVFAINSPLIDKITVTKKGSVRRKKLTFIDKMEKEYKPKERN